VKSFYKNKWTIIGLFLVVFGWGPFLVALLLKISGSQSNLDLNGLGLLLFATFWPALVCFSLAIAQVLSKRTGG
jgi:hypothetical protein